MGWLAFLFGTQAASAPTEAEKSALERGEVVTRQATNRGGSEGTSMVLVDATTDEVWTVVEDFGAYVEFLPYVTASELLAGPDALGEGTWRWSMELTAKGVVTRFVTESRREGDVMTWAMTPASTSPMRRSTGSWEIQPWDAERVLLIYRAQADTAWWVPVFVHKKAADAGLPTMVRLVGERAERG